MTNNKNEGWIQGVVWAAGFMAGTHNEGCYAQDILGQSGLSKKELSKAINYDLDECRTDSECKEYLKDVKGVD